VKAVRMVPSDCHEKLSMTVSWYHPRKVWYCAPELWSLYRTLI